ncbi:PREDICTED: myelin regulatory factor isoform X2 [Nicrophorus vespilloides]|uniref:Myelin regulatory factor isoform X2 n=1 Tax=Nicrophorus vespilloides TaxID=110193 RepID=A0ABM1M3T5_NICVS|nr:PREDICTED: myelin regulatory factor isoform X2 [Nicrophorus vespilloides]
MEYNWTQNMDERPNRSNRGRGGDFVGGIDNEALDFSQLEAFINSEGSQSNGNYFGDSLGATGSQQNASGKLLNVIVQNKRMAGHSLPESPPDSSSEHPYSPPDNCDAALSAAPDAIYTTLGQPIYKQNMLNPIMNDGIILGSHIVVAEPTGPGDQQLMETGNLIHQDATRILLNSDDMLTDDQNRSMMTANNAADAYDRRNSEILLVKNQQTDANLMHLGFTSNSLDIQIPQRLDNLCDNNGLDNIQQVVYTNLQNVPKKRKLSQDLTVKSEPEHCTTSQLSPSANISPSLDEDYPASETCLSDSQYQCIRFQAFQQTAWHALCDQNLTELPSPHYRVDADKGFNFSNADDAFVCQKKNHFQITCHVQLLGDAQFVKTSDGFQKVSSFHLHFYGVKHDCPTQTIRVEQSQSDRSKKPFHPVLVELINSQVTKVTVGRLHFSETTSNNMRKKGKPNPEQRYFQLVVGLHAHTAHGNFPIISHASQKIIVRASNPGQFESDVELCWQKGQTQDSIFHAGKVGVNTDRPDESLVVHGNIKITGHIVQPSDVRAKKNIVECNTAEQLSNVQKMRVVKYEYDPGFAKQLNRTGGYCDTGVIAQEIAKILPEAVSPAGNLILGDGTAIDDFLVVNKERIFMENIGAVKELCKVTDNLETRIDQLERINKRLNKFGNNIKYNSYNKSSKMHNCNIPDSESIFCSNKFIQVVIVVLVLIMAFCLATITVLYLLQASRHNQLTQASLQAVRHAVTTHSPSKMKPSTLQTFQQVHTTPMYKENIHISGLTKHPMNGLRSKQVIGRPPACNSVEDEIDHPNLCQIYCCVPPKLDTNIVEALYGVQNARKNKSETLLNLEEKNRQIGKSLHTNNIDKHLQRRDADYWHDKDNNYDTVGDELHFTIIIQGKSFNTTLTDDYLDSHSSNGNYTYYIQISKYMPDEYINIIFQSSQAHLKDIEHCNSHKQTECPMQFEEKNSMRKVNENVPSQQINSQSVSFEVDLHTLHSKLTTYRASLKQNQNKCKLSTTKVGIEFTEYNFFFIRYCDD